MKIDRTDSPQYPYRAEKKKIQNPTGQDFSEIFKNTVSTFPGMPQTGTPQSLPPVGSIACFIPSTDRKELVGKADQLLHLLETYQKALSGFGLPINEAYASMKAIEDRADELTPHIERLPEQDDFRNYLNRLVITASVEAIKFRRGDYL